MDAVEAFRLRNTTGQKRHDRVFAVGSHEYLRLDSWRDICPNDLLVLGDSLTGEVSHSGFLICPQIHTGSGVVNLSESSTPEVARPKQITFVCHALNGLIYASGQAWNDPSHALNHDFRAAEWRWLDHDDPWYQSLNFGECIVIPRAELTD